MLVMEGLSCSGSRLLEASPHALCSAAGPLSSDSQSHTFDDRRLTEAFPGELCVDEPCWRLQD